MLVRRADQTDRPAVERFIAATFEGLARFKGPDRWLWQFVDNPFLTDMGAQPPIWLALDGDDVVGQIAVQGTDLHLDGLARSAGWIVDVMILPAYRGRGIGHLLLEAVTQEVPILMMLTMAPATRRMAERRGAITLGPTRQLSRWGRLRADDVRRYLIQRAAHRPGLQPVVRWACSRLALHHALARLSTPWLRIRDLRRSPPARSLAVVETREPGKEIDDLWRRAQAGYKAICPRDSRFLAWRFMSCPDLRYRIFLAYRDGRVAGYSVLRRAAPEELRLGIIADLFAERGDMDVFGSLVAHAIDHFGNDVASIECATSEPEIEALLRRAGFFLSRTLAPTVNASDAGAREAARTLRDGWFFSKADHDWDQIRLA